MTFEIGEKTTNALTMAEIVKLKADFVVNEPMLVVPPEIVSAAFELQHDLKTTSQYLESCYLVYRDCTINHAAYGIAMQRQNGIYQWLRPENFSWSDVDIVTNLGNQVKEREAEKFESQVQNSVPVYDILGQLLYYQRRPVLDRMVNFIIPAKLGFADSMDWTQVTARSLYHPAYVLKDYLDGDELLEYQGRRILLDILEHLRQPVPC